MLSVYKHCEVFFHYKHEVFVLNYVKMTCYSLFIPIHSLLCSGLLSNQQKMQTGKPFVMKSNHLFDFIHTHTNYHDNLKHWCSTLSNSIKMILLRKVSWSEVQLFLLMISFEIRIVSRNAVLRFESFSQVFWIIYKTIASNSWYDN